MNLWHQQKNKIIYIFMLIIACNLVDGDQKHKRAADAIDSSSLESIAQACGAAISIEEISDKPVGSLFPLVINYQQAICGKVAGGEEGQDTTWQALGAAVMTSEVFVKEQQNAGLALNESSKAQLYINKNSDVIAKYKGEDHLVGRIESQELGYPVTFKDQVKIGIYYDNGQPYQVGLEGNREAKKVIGITLDL